MIDYERPIRFEEVDAAGIVFFGRFSSYCHDAMERLFDAVSGGYATFGARRNKHASGTATAAVNPIK